MKRLVRILFAAVLIAQGSLAGPAAADAIVPPIDARLACTAVFDATKVDGDANAVVLRIVDAPRPFQGTVTAFGRDRSWSGTIERSARVQKRYGGVEQSVMLRADGPIEGVTYTPSWPECTLHTGVRARNGYDAADVDRPVVVLAKPQPIEPVTCARPYRNPTVLRASDPQTPMMAQQQGIRGTVRIAVGLDENGVPQFTNVVASPSVILNAAALQAARRSTYAGAIFRCRPVPAGYQFAVEFP